MMSLVLQNLAVYCLQVAILVAVGGLLPFLFRLDSVRARLAWWQGLLAACLLLPLIQPWKQTLIDSAISVTTGAMMLAPNSLPSAPAPFPWKTVLAGVLLAGILARLLWLALGFHRLRTYLDGAAIYDCPLARRMEIHAFIGLSEEISSPVTFGFGRPVVLFPARFAEMNPAMQETVACHELLHVHRRDWLFTVFEEFVRAALWFHPAVWWLLGEIQLTREQVVDQEVVRLTASRDEYLNALVAIASARTRLDLAPAPLFLRKRHLAQRVSRILKEVRMSRRRIAASLACISSALLIAAWLVVHSFPLQAAPQAPRPDSPGVSVDQAEANLLHRAPVEYPVEARAKGIQGTVVLEIEIDENGNVADARVVSGPQELRKAALQSVLQWHYSKNMQLPAKTQVNVKFELPPKSEGAPSTGVAGGVPGGAVRRGVIGGGVIGGIIGSVPAPGAASPPVLKTVDLGSLPEELQKELRDKIGKYEGSTLTAEVMMDLRRDMLAVDSHLNLSSMRTSAGPDGTSVATVRITLGPPAPAAVWSKDAAQADAGGNPPQRIRVGGNVQQSMLVEQTRPAYPPLAKQARIQGVVRLEALIGKDGKVENLTVQSGHPLLVPAALEAVRTWVYQPTLLNGQPVEVVTTIDVNFTLSE